MEHGRMGLDTTVIEDAFWHNIRVIKADEKVRVIKGRSQEVLRKLPFDTYDFAYIDGSHVASDVLTDAVLVFPLIKRGGIVVFDDYHWEDEDNILDRPKMGIDAFLEVI